MIPPPVRNLLRWLRTLLVPPPPPRAVEARDLADVVPKPPARRPPPPPDRDRYGPWEELALLLFSGRAPEGIEVGHSLALATLRLRSIPPGFRVAGDLDLRQCQRLQRIGAGLSVAGDLIIGGRCLDAPWWQDFVARAARGEAEPPAVLGRRSLEAQSPLRALPPGLQVAGNLQVRQARHLTGVPEDWRVGGSIHLEGCSALRSLPEGLVVHGDLVIKAAPSLLKLPAGLRVEGSLRLVGVRVDRLPDGLHVGGDLHLECCPRLATLPDGLAVGGSLIVRRCPVTRLPGGLRVGRDLRLLRLAEFAELPEGLHVPGRVEVDRCPRVEAIPPGFRVGTDLAVVRSEALRALPAGLRVPGTLDLRGCTRLAALPAGLNVGSRLKDRPLAPALRLADCSSLTTLPTDLVVGGPIEVAGSGLLDLPDRLFRSARILWRGVVVAPKVVFRPETLSAEEILGQPNAELRRVMLERAGLDRVLAESRAQVVDADADLGGPRRLIWLAAGWIIPADPRCFLQCRCPSTGRDYLLRVPPETRTCRQAAAWLAGYDDPEAYRPILET